MGNSLSTAFLPILLLAFLAMMFLSSRKQRRQVQETQQMQSALADGDEWGTAERRTQADQCP